MSVAVFFVSVANMLMLELGEDRIWNNKEQRIDILQGYEFLYQTGRRVTL